jgi:hypothetical protein
MTRTTPTTKRCADCKTTKDTKEFHKLKRQPDGLAVRCKACAIERLNPYKAQLAKAKKLEGGARFSIVRNTNRRTGQASWGIWDNAPYDNTNPVVFVGDNLKETLLEVERLNAPPEKIRYTKRGQIGFVTNDEVEVE